MNKLPDLTDEKKMAEVGRRSSIMRARHEVCEKFRDLAVSIQSIDIWRDDVSALCNEARAAIERLEAVKKLTEV